MLWKRCVHGVVVRGCDVIVVVAALKIAPPLQSPLSPPTQIRSRAADRPSIHVCLHMCRAYVHAHTNTPCYLLILQVVRARQAGQRVIGEPVASGESAQSSTPVQLCTSRTRRMLCRGRGGMSVLHQLLLAGRGMCTAQVTPSLMCPVLLTPSTLQAWP